MAYTTINKSGDYFNTKLYTGTGSENAISGVGFQPDWTWIKNRDTTDWHRLFDAIRGATEELYSNESNAETTQAQSLKSFDTDGFTLGTLAEVNTSSENYASWNWLANGAGSANTDGTINSTATSANTTAGFSIVKYTGNGSTNQTVGHGLGAEPDFIIIKQTNTTRNWPTYSKAMGNGVAFLDITDAWNGGSGYTNYWYTSGMTSTTFGISNNDNNNQSGGTYIAYVFSSKTGYSKFGKYTGNGNADGTFVYLGFKPAFVLVKNTQQGGDNWFMWDNKRPGYNQTQKYLSPNNSNAEADSSSYAIDTLSNGFKVRASTGAINNNNETMIYMAFAAAPLVGTNNVPANAR